MRVIALLLCMSLLLGCATTLKHPDTGTQIECRTDMGTFHASDLFIVPLLPILVPVYFIIGGPFWGGPIKDFRDCVHNAKANGFVEKEVEE